MNRCLPDSIGHENDRLMSQSNNFYMENSDCFKAMKQCKVQIMK